MLVEELADVLCEVQSRVRDPFGHLLKHILSEKFEGLTDISHRGLRYGYQQGCQFEKGRVSFIGEPGFDEDAVLWLQLEVFSNIIHNDHPRDVSPDTRQVLNIEA